MWQTKFLMKRNCFVYYIIKSSNFVEYINFMKIVIRLLLLVCLLVGIASEVHSQTKRNRFTSDFHVGFNFSDMNVSGGVGNEFNEPKIGMNLGMNFNYKIYHNLQLQTGFFVTKKGLKQDIVDIETSAMNDVTITNDLNHTVANYMQFPLCVGYEVYLTNKFAFNINGGAYLAYGYKGTYENKHYVEYRYYDGSIVTNPIETQTGETFDLQK